MQQCRKGKGKASELPECSQCVKHGLKCELRPGKSTSCTKCHEAKTKCKWPSEEMLERKCKWMQAEELEAGLSSSKRLKKMLEERSDRFAELAEVLEAGLKAITDALGKQERLLQELVELEADKVELMQYGQWTLEDEEDEDEDEVEEGEEVEVEQELSELAKEQEENGDGSEEEEEVEQ